MLHFNREQYVIQELGYNLHTHTHTHPTQLVLIVKKNKKLTNVDYNSMEN